MVDIHVYDCGSKAMVSSKDRLLENLANYINCPQSALRINKTDNGKPELTGVEYHGGFSISHSRNLLVQAFSSIGVIGIDVEYKNHRRNYLKLAKRYFHTQEYNYIRRLDENSSMQWFYKLWTAKEAVCKAEGGRLWYYLRDNYLVEDNTNRKTMINLIKGLTIMQYQHIAGFSLTIATEEKPDRVRFIYA
ncbi:MAG TPA: 4'-phosphopantetheinyl transferase superfamily protein [Oceanospirillales bacterium]|nr:4'-phosphopantetheinyl transferase superfamily protein [Oceanospirillales bacterium]